MFELVGHGSSLLLAGDFLTGVAHGSRPFKSALLFILNAFMIV